MESDYGHSRIHLLNCGLFSSLNCTTGHITMGLTFLITFFVVGFITTHTPPDPAEEPRIAVSSLEGSSMEAGDTYCPAPIAAMSFETKRATIRIMSDCQAQGLCLNEQGTGCRAPIIWKGDEL